MADDVKEMTLTELIDELMFRERYLRGRSDYTEAEALMDADMILRARADVAR